MRWMARGWMLVGVLVALSLSAGAQVATTTVADTVYRADGTPATGTVLVSWGSVLDGDGSFGAGWERFGGDCGGGAECAACAECGFEADGELLYGGVSPG